MKSRSMMPSDELFKVEEQSLTPEKGVVLIAEPFLYDRYFGQSVIWLTEHNSEGTVGFVLNKPLERRVHELIDGFPEFSAPVSLGGPVSPESLHFIHQLGNSLPGSIPIGDRIYYGGNFDLLAEMIRKGRVQPGQIKFFVGYAGWGAGQLEEEIRTGSWVLARIPGKSSLSPSSSLFWRTSLYSLGNKYRVWSHFPTDPLLN